MVHFVRQTGLPRGEEPVSQLSRASLVAGALAAAVVFAQALLSSPLYSVPRIMALALSLVGLSAGVWGLFSVRLETAARIDRFCDWLGVFLSGISGGIAWFLL